MKKVLLFMTDFYGYNKEIISGLANAGYDVTWKKDKIELSFFERIICKFFSNYKNKKFDKYFNRTIKNITNNKYDKIIIIFAANFMKLKHIEILRKTFFNTKIVYYAWDSVSNFPGIEELFKSADNAYTFDKEDAKKYNVGFLPLFYVNSDVVTKKKDGISTILSFYNEKCNQIEKIFNCLPSTIENSIYFKIKGWYYLFRIKNNHKNFYLKYKNYFHRKSLSRLDCIDSYSSAFAVIDVPLPRQNGLTMRTFEALSIGTKVITTNKNIVEYDFYTPTNIFIVDENTKYIDDIFFKTHFDYEKKPSSSYSLDSFINTLISD